MVEPSGAVTLTVTNFLQVRLRLSFIVGGLGSGSRVEVRVYFRNRRGCHADCIAHDKQAAYVGFSPVYSRAELRPALRAGSVSHAQCERIVLAELPSGRGHADLIDPLELECAVLAVDVDCHTAVAVAIYIVAVDTVSAGCKVDGVAGKVFSSAPFRAADCPCLFDRSYRYTAAGN